MANLNPRGDKKGGNDRPKRSTPEQSVQSRNQNAGDRAKDRLANEKKKSHDNHDDPSRAPESGTQD